MVKQQYHVLNLIKCALLQRKKLCLAEINALKTNVSNIIHLVNGPIAYLSVSVISFKNIL